jgi:uncharacterized protein YuzE
MKPASYYTGLTDGDIAYFRVRPARPGHVTSERHHWGLRDLGELLGLELWDASQRLPTELLEALPLLDGPRVTITADHLTHRA